MCKNVDKLSSWPLKSELPSAPREARPAGSSQASRFLFLQPWLLLTFGLEGDLHDSSASPSHTYDNQAKPELPCWTITEPTCLPLTLLEFDSLHASSALKIPDWSQWRPQTQINTQSSLKRPPSISLLGFHL
ncbi:hypothetical protein KC367_g150 [Hortaea werneckii]|nr:hypothetical protein KC367_g150 [Hortaea werneckii]